MRSYPVGTQMLQGYDPNDPAEASIPARSKIEASIEGLGHINHCTAVSCLCCLQHVVHPYVHILLILLQHTDVNLCIFSLYSFHSMCTALGIMPITCSWHLVLLA